MPTCYECETMESVLCMRGSAPSDATLMDYANWLCLEKSQLHVNNFPAAAADRPRLSAFTVHMDTSWMRTCSAAS